MDKICRQSSVGALFQGTRNTEASEPLRRPVTSPRSAFRTSENWLYDAHETQSFQTLSPRNFRGVVRLSSCDAVPSRMSPRDATLQPSLSARSLFRAQDAMPISNNGLRSPRRPSLPSKDSVASLLRGQSEGNPFSARNNGAFMREPSSRDMIREVRESSKDARSQSRDVAQRARSPTYDMSVDWMSFSKPRDDRPLGDGSLPSSNFKRPVQRLHRGKITQNSVNWLRVAGEDAKPIAPEIANSQNYHISRGKKTGLRQDPDAAKQLITSDNSRPANTRESTRRHEFPDHPQVARHVDQLRVLSPRSLQQASRDDIRSPRGRSPGSTVGIQHRTSGEMAASLVDISCSYPMKSEKYLCGGEILDMENAGRRRADRCLKNAVKDHPVMEKSMKQGSFRHHLNSDIVKQHVSPLDGGYPHILGSLPTSREEANRRVHVFGDFSTTPSSMAKDTAYIHSGLKVVKYQTRSAGTFSPNAPRVRASEMLGSFTER